MKDRAKRGLSFTEPLATLGPFASNVGRIGAEFGLNGARGVSVSIGIWTLRVQYF